MKHYVRTVDIALKSIVYACREGTYGDEHTIDPAHVTCPTCAAYVADMQERRAAGQVIEHVKTARLRLTTNDSAKVEVGEHILVQGQNPKDNGVYVVVSKQGDLERKS